MASNLNELIQNIRAIVKEPVENFFYDAYLTVEINHAQADLAMRLPADCLPKLQVTKKHNTVVGQSEYSLRPSAGIGSAVFEGKGLNDATSGGTFTGIVDMDYRVKITTAAATDKFQYSDDGGVTWSGEIDIVSGAIALNNGVTITFGATTGHTVGDKWGFWVRVAPLEIMRLIVAKLNGVVCHQIFTQDIKMIENSSYYDATADFPVCYVWGEKIIIKPAVSLETINGVEIMGIREPETLVIGEDVPEITRPYHRLLELYTSGQAFLIHNDAQGGTLLSQYEATCNGLVSGMSGASKVDYPLTPSPQGG